MGYQIELRHLHYFLAVAEELHFHRAAERLHISQPGLSRQIHQMEEILGFNLFERNKRKVVLSPAGQYLQAEVKFLINHLEAMQRQAAQIAKGNAGELRVGFLGSASHEIIPHMLKAFRQYFPGIRTVLEEMPNPQQIASLLNNKIDLGFVRLAQAPEGLQMRAVQEDTFSLVLPADHPLDMDHFQSLAQVKGEDFILFSSDYSSYYYDLIIGICRDAGFYPSVSHKSVHALTIYRLVEHGLGLAIVPSSLAHGYDLKVKFIPLSTIPQRTILSVIWNPANRNPLLDRVLSLSMFETVF
jgi:DNA-binding transcriptional LysR family regulator